MTASLTGRSGADHDRGAVTLSSANVLYERDRPAVGQVIAMPSGGERVGLGHGWESPGSPGLALQDLPGAPMSEDVSQVSLPIRILLVGAVVFMAAYLSLIHI